MSNISFFKTVMKVLESLYAPHSSDNNDSKIKKSLNMMRGKYGDVFNEKGPDFSKEVNRVAYIFRYVTAHADMLHDLLLRSKHIQKILARNKATVTCLGGGPGTEILAFSRYVVERALDTKLTFNLVDKESGWLNAWSNVDEILQETIQSSRNAAPCDITKPDSWRQCAFIKKADIFVASWFLSEVYSIKNDAKEFFTDLFLGAKSGSIFIFLDFAHSNTTQFMNELEVMGKLEVLEKKDSESFQLSFTEDKKALGDFLNRFGNPKLTGKIATRILVKP